MVNSLAFLIYTCDIFNCIFLICYLQFKLLSKITPKKVLLNTKHISVKLIDINNICIFRFAPKGALYIMGSLVFSNCSVSMKGHAHENSARARNQFVIRHLHSVISDAFK